MRLLTTLTLVVCGLGLLACSDPEDTGIGLCPPEHGFDEGAPRAFDAHVYNGLSFPIDCDCRTGEDVWQQTLARGQSKTVHVSEGADTRCQCTFEVVSAAMEPAIARAWRWRVEPD